MDAERVRSARVGVQAARFQLRSLRNVTRDTLAAIASLSDDLDALASELDQLEGTAEGGHSHEQESTVRPGHDTFDAQLARCVA